MSWSEIGAVLATVRAICQVDAVTVATHERAVELAERYRLSFYDATIVAAALLAGCSTLYTEDLQHGQLFERRLRVVDPFR